MANRNRFTKSKCNATIIVTISCSQGVVFYENYAAAGIAAYERGLLTRGSLDDVIQSCQDELDKLTFKGPDANEKHMQRKLELLKDCDRLVKYA